MSQNAEPPRRSPSARATLAILIGVAIVAVLAARRMYRSPYSASDLFITPDEVEYAVCAQRVATLGRYDMDFDGTSVAPHSTPWFSGLLAPAYVVGPREIGNGILVVLAIAVFGVIAAGLAATRVAQAVGGALAVIALLWLPGFPRAARLIMTDAPSAAVAFVCLWLFLRDRGRTARVRDTLLAGALVALAFALRSVYLSLAIPFAWRAWRARERRAAHTAALLGPICAVLAANAIYNQLAFGDWRRTGYQYWLAVPYDYLELCVSLSYLRQNIAGLASESAVRALVLGAIGTAALAIRRPSGWGELLAFGAATALPIAALHLVYFYSDERFYVYPLSLCAVIGAAGVASLMPVSWRRQPWLALALLAAAFFALPPLGDRMDWFLPDGQPPRRATADLVHRTTPDDAVVISDVEPVYLAAVAPVSSRRTYLAASRDVEFASKVLVRERIDRELAAPRGPFDHAAPGLLAHGGRRAIPATADEMHEQIDAWVRSGRPVFVATLYTPNRAALARMLGATLRLANAGARVTRVVAR